MCVFLGEIIQPVYIKLTRHTLIAYIYTTHFHVWFGISGKIRSLDP